MEAAVCARPACRPARSLGPKPPQPQGVEHGTDSSCHGAKIWDDVRFIYPAVESFRPSIRMTDLSCFVHEDRGDLLRHVRIRLKQASTALDSMPQQVDLDVVRLASGGSVLLQQQTPRALSGSLALRLFPLTMSASPSNCNSPSPDYAKLSTLLVFQIASCLLRTAQTVQITLA